MKKKQELINSKLEQITSLKADIRNICFEHIKESKDVEIGDLIHIPSKDKYAIFSELHTETIENSVLKCFALTKLGMPGKKITTFSLKDVEKCKDTIENIISTSFSGEDFDADKAIDSCRKVQAQLKESISK